MASGTGEVPTDAAAAAAVSTGPKRSLPLQHTVLKGSFAAAVTGGSSLAAVIDEAKQCDDQDPAASTESAEDSSDSTPAAGAGAGTTPPVSDTAGASDATSNTDEDVTGSPILAGVSLAKDLAEEEVELSAAAKADKEADKLAGKYGDISKGLAESRAAKKTVSKSAAASSKKMIADESPTLSVASRRSARGKKVWSEPPFDPAVEAEKTRLHTKRCSAYSEPFVTILSVTIPSHL